MADVLTNMIADSVQQDLENQTSKFAPILRSCVQQLNAFYNYALPVLGLSNSVFDQMKNTQGSIKIKDLTQSLYDSFRQQLQYEEKYQDLLQIAQNGYRLLAITGEQLRSINNNSINKIQYNIYMDDGETLAEASLDLESFLQTFQLSSKGDIVFNTSGLDFTTPSILKDQYATMKQLVDEKRATFLDIFSIQQENGQRKLKEDVKKYIQQYISRQETRDALIDYVENNDEEQAMSLLLSVTSGKYTYGRAIEGAAKLYNNPSLALETAYSKVLTDVKRFYQGPDFELGNQQIQAKMTNAGQKVRTILNGISRLTRIILDFTNRLEKISQKAVNDIKNSNSGAEEKAYQNVEKRLMAMFRA